MSITYIPGNVTNPIGDGIKVVPHCVNDIGVMGSGVAKALADKWPLVKQTYIEWFETKRNLKNLPFELGNTDFIWVTPEIIVANMIGQSGIGYKNGVPAIRYEALGKCMNQVKSFISGMAWDHAVDHDLSLNISIHAPKFGALRAGGDWRVIEDMINEEWVNNGHNVTIYEFAE